MNYVFKKRKSILLGILFVAIVVCTPFLFGEEGCDDGLNEVANSVDQNIQNDVDNNKSSAVIEPPTVVDGRVLFLNKEIYMKFTKNIDMKILQKEGTVINGFKSYYQVLHNIGDNPALREESEEDTVHLYNKFTPSNLAAVLNEKKELQIGDSITRFDDDYAFIYHKNEENTIDNTIREFYSLLDSKSTTIEKSIFYNGIKIAKIIRKKASCYSQNSNNAREAISQKCDDFAKNSWLREYWEPAKRIRGDVYFWFCRDEMRVNLHLISEFGPRNWFGGRIWRNRVIPSMYITYNVRYRYEHILFYSMTPWVNSSGQYAESNVSYIDRILFNWFVTYFEIDMYTMTFSGTDDVAGTRTFSLPFEHHIFR